MKILQVCPKFHHSVASGSTKVAYCITKKLSGRGHSVTIYTSDMRDKYTKMDNGIEEINGVNVHRFRSIGTIFTREMKIFVTPTIITSLKNHVRSFDIIHMHEYRSFQNVVVHHYARKYGVSYIVQAHGSLPRIIAKQRLKWIYDVLFGHRLLRDATKVIALSQMEAKQYRDMGVPDEKIEIIPNGIDLSEYDDLPHKGSFKNKIGIDKTQKIILYLGRIHKMKGIDFLVKAYSYLVNNMKFNNIILVIAGPDDGYITKLKLLVTSLNIINNVIFTGMLSEKEKIIAYMDSSMVVNVEPRNVFGLVPLEAAASLTPVIVSNGNAISDIVRKGKFGFSVRFGDAVELAEIMNKMLDDDKLLREMGQKGRKFVFKNFHWDNQVIELEKVYEEIVGC